MTGLLHSNKLSRVVLHKEKFSNHAYFENFGRYKNFALAKKYFAENTKYFSIAEKYFAHQARKKKLAKIYLELQK